MRKRNASQFSWKQLDIYMEKSALVFIKYDIQKMTFERSYTKVPSEMSNLLEGGFRKPL